MSRHVTVHWGSKTFGITTDGGLVTEAAPVLKWAIGKPEAVVAKWLRGKGASFGDRPPPPQRERDHGRAVQRCWCVGLAPEEITAAELVIATMGGTVTEVNLGKRREVPQRLCSSHQPRSGQASDGVKLRHELANQQDVHSQPPPQRIV